MVKKKNKNRQQGPDEQNASDSTESCDETQIENAGGKCPHVLKAVDFPRVKKYLKSSGIQRECADCLKSVARDAAEVKEDGQPGLWLCLRCGNQSCGRDKGQHALKHYQTPRSELHALVVNTELWQVWCYECNLEIPATSKKKLHECLEFIKRQEDASVKTTKPVVNATREGKEEQDTCLSNAIVRPLALTADGKDLPRVRGLCNNGNTCFFNAVLQCLAHTPFLLPILEEMREPGEKFTLPGGKFPGFDEECPPVSGELGKWGELTETLASTLGELRSGQAEVFNPAPLLNKLMQKCPLFEGGDQHDSQELLRHLLEGVRKEDLRRYQATILSHVGLDKRADPSKVEDDMKVRLKLYGRQASDLMLRPDQVFRGSLVSTLECQDCLHVSQRTETFLDLSLPVMADKPQPPTAQRRKSSEEALELNQPSKHQLKKEKKLARKGKKRSAGSKNRSVESGEPTIDEENTNASAESEQSDADVEDNLEQDVDGKKDIGESGYSSEKAANEDSAVESPMSAGINGDSALTSPASPVCVGGSGSPIPLPYTPLSLEANGAERHHPVSPVSDVELHFATSCHINSHEIVNPAFDEAVDLAMLSDHELVHLDRHSLDVKIPHNEELMITIPSSPLASRTKKGSPVSQDSLSPPSSEINLEMPSPSLGQDPSSTTTPIPDLERPGSRFAFTVDVPVNSPGPEWLSKKATVEEEEETVEPMKNLSLDAHVADTSSETVMPYISEEEVKQLLHNLSKETLNISIDEDRALTDGNVSLVVCEEDNAYGPVPSPKHNKDSVVNHIIAVDREKAVSNSATLSPKYTTDDGECSVMSCLNQFTAVELMTGNNKVGCEACTERQNQGKEGKMVLTNSTKQFLISSPPPVLILHLKRFQLQRSLLKKMPRHVSFPRVLDLAPSISTKSKDDKMVPSGQRQVLYSLYGIVEHSGTLQYGHYIAYVKVRAPVSSTDPRWRFIHPDQADAPALPAEPPGKWYCVSDSRVNEVSEDKVMRSEAYLLFYERIW